MLHKIVIQILAFMIAITIGIFAIGALLIGPAPSAVGTLSADFPVESVQISAANKPAVQG